MLWLSLSYSIISLAILISLFAIIAIKQLELRNLAVYYLLGLILSIIGWVIGDMMQIIFSAAQKRETVLVFSRFATISSMLAMLFALLFARVLTAKRVLNSITVAIAFTLLGGVIALTLIPSYTIIEVKGVDFYKTQADTLWLILDATMVIFAGSIFLSYLFRQKRIVGKKYKNTLNLMIIGVIIAFFVSIVLYAIYAVWFFVPMLHLELLSASIGALIIGISMLLGGKEVTYYTSRVFSLHIFEENGISLFSCVFQTGYTVDDQLISGVASAITSFAAELIGKKVFPYEIDLGDYSLLLAKKEQHIALIVAEYPTAHLRRSLNKIIEAFDPEISTEKMCDIIESKICYEPRVLVY